VEVVVCRADTSANAAERAERGERTLRSSSERLGEVERSGDIVQTLGDSASFLGVEVSAGVIGVLQD
jgi:hypothetical protein